MLIKFTKQLSLPDFRLSSPFAKLLKHSEQQPLDYTESARVKKEHPTAAVPLGTRTSKVATHNTQKAK